MPQLLVACSDPCDRYALLSVLSSPRLTIQEAGTMIEAEKILSPATAIVFCEDRLAGGGYRELLRKIQQAGLQVPLVVSSTTGGPEQYLEAMELGADDYITPPYRKQVIEAIVERRRDRRHSLILPIQVYGVDAAGVPFFQNARTRDISSGGACLVGIRSTLRVGDLIGVNYCEQANVCRVVWIGESEEVGSAKEVGVENLDPAGCSWNFGSRLRVSSKG